MEIEQNKKLPLTFNIQQQQQQQNKDLEKKIFLFEKCFKYYICFMSCNVKVHHNSKKKLYIFFPNWVQKRTENIYVGCSCSRAKHIVFIICMRFHSIFFALFSFAVAASATIAAVARFIHCIISSAHSIVFNNKSV